MRLTLQIFVNLVRVWERRPNGPRVCRWVERRAGRRAARRAPGGGHAHARGPPVGTASAPWAWATATPLTTGPTTTWTSTWRGILRRGVAWCHYSVRKARGRWWRKTGRVPGAARIRPALNQTGGVPLVPPAHTTRDDVHVCTSISTRVACIDVADTVSGTMIDDPFICGNLLPMVKLSIFMYSTYKIVRTVRFIRVST